MIESNARMDNVGLLVYNVMSYSPKYPLGLYLWTYFILLRSIVE